MNFSNFRRCMDFAQKPQDNQILLKDSLLYLGRSQHTPLWPTWCRNQYRRRCHQNMRYPALPVEISSNISSYTLTNKNQLLSSISFFFHKLHRRSACHCIKTGIQDELDLQRNLTHRTKQHHSHPP
jgi:hypothetical protein